MSEIRVPGQPQVNPLLVLAESMGEVTKQLRIIAANTKHEERHIYALARASSEAWGSYCLACSESADEYIYPCKLHDAANPIPPGLIKEISPVNAPP